MKTVTQSFVEYCDEMELDLVSILPHVERGTKIGKILHKIFIQQKRDPEWYKKGNSDYYVMRGVLAWRADELAKNIVILKEYDDIYKVYASETLESCMTGAPDVAAYTYSQSENLAVAAYMVEGVAMARIVVNTDSKIMSQSYGPCSQEVEYGLKELGYGTAYDTSTESDVELVFKSRDGDYFMPYFDGGGLVVVLSDVDGRATGRISDYQGGEEEDVFIKDVDHIPEELWADVIGTIRYKSNGRGFPATELEARVVERVIGQEEIFDWKSRTIISKDVTTQRLVWVAIKNSTHFAGV